MSTPPHTTMPTSDVDALITNVTTMVDIPAHTHGASRVHAGEHMSTAAMSDAAPQATVAAVTSHTPYLVTTAPDTTTTHAHTQPDTMSDSTPNSTLASHLTVEQSQREVASAAAAVAVAASTASEFAKCQENRANEMHHFVNNSSTVGPMVVGQVTNLISTSSYSNPATNNFLSSVTTSGPLASTPTTAVVAPALASPNSAHQTHSISIDSRPIPLNQASLRSASHTAHDRLGLHAEADLQEEKGGPRSLSKVETADYISNFFINRHHAAASVAPVTSSPPQRTIDTTCHCLIVDETRLGAVDSTDRLKYSAALALASDRPTLKAHVTSWMQTFFSSPNATSNVCAVHIPLREKERIHINFTSVEALYAALAACSFLVRCGSLSSGAWQGNNKPCGPHRHTCPEMVQFTFTPSRPIAPSEVEAKMKAVIAEMELEYTSLWQSSSSRAATVSTGGSSRIQFNLLPRNASLVEAFVKQRHLQSEIHGGKIRIQAPNSSALCRCTQCDQLGHQSNKCTMYHGFAMRLPMNRPMSYHGMTQLVSLAGARVGFIGSGIDEMKPSRRVTLLYDIDSTSAAQLEKVMVTLASIIDSEALDLFAAPYSLKNIQDRTSECVECGNLDRAHACHFQQAWFNAALTRSSRGNTATTATAAANEAPVASEEQQQQQRSMCRSWFKIKSCPRQQKGEHCKYDHPVDHVVPSNECFEHKRFGQCTRTDCRYTHPVQQQAAADANRTTATPETAQPSRAASTTAAATAATAAATPASRATSTQAPAAAAPAMVAPTPSSSAPAASPKKRGRATRSDVEAAAAAATSAAATDEDDDAAMSAPPPSRPTASRNAASSTASRIAKKQKSSEQPIPLTQRWSTLHDDESEEDKPSSPATPTPTRTPSSSLSFLTSPNKSTPAVTSKIATTRRNKGGSTHSQ